MPPTGNHPVRAASISSSRPERISGTDSQTKAMSDSILSTHEYCRTAAQMPSGTASPQVTTAAAPASISVLPSPSLMTVNTGWWRENDSPKSKCSRMFFEIQAVLDVPRPVEAEVPAHRLDGRRRDGRVLRHLIEEVARRELQQHESQRRDPEAAAGSSAGSAGERRFVIGWLRLVTS